MLVTSRPVLVPPWLKTKPSRLPNKEVKTKFYVSYLVLEVDFLVYFSVHS